MGFSRYQNVNKPIIQSNIEKRAISPENLVFFGGFFIFREEERISELIPNNAFEFIIATSEYVFRKPNKRIFELALEKAALLPEEVWYIGDNYECDIVGAKNAGMYPVWYLGARDIQAKKGDVLTVKDWETLKNMMLK